MLENLDESSPGFLFELVSEPEALQDERRQAAGSGAGGADDYISKSGCVEMWQDASPIWYRPQYYGGELYKSDTFLQVVGHTPLGKITREGNLISCDVFSTDRDRKPIGTQEYLIIDTLTWAQQGIR